MTHIEVTEKEFNDRLQFFNMELIVVSNVPYICEFFIEGEVYVGEITGDEGDRKFYLTKSFIEEENKTFRKFLLNNSQK